MDIKVFNQFMSKQEASRIVNYIDNNLNRFNSHQDGRYKLLQFGKDGHYDSPVILSGVDEIKDLVIEYFDKVLNKVKNEYIYNSDLFINSFWLTKQVDGAHVGIHNDIDSKNTQFVYSCGIYLNDMLSDGEISFPNLNYMHKPKCGDFVCWPSKSLNYDHEVKKISSDRYGMFVWLTNDKNYALKY
jgi:hypothetical protein